MIIPVGYGQANFVFAGTSVPRGAQCTLGFQNIAAMTAVGAAEAIRALWDAEIMPTLEDTIRLDFVAVKLGPNSTGPQGLSGLGATGGDTGSGVPPQVAVLIRKNTALGGRKNRGRMYLPGLDEADIFQDGSIDSTKATAIETGFDDFLAGMLALDLPPVILHNDVTTPTPITSFSVQSTAATQRRRLRG